MKDERHIRVDGKPLLLVYRPSLLPSAKETVKRWRVWCRNNGVGEIYLAYTQSFEAIDPGKYGFDAAVEFPPNNMAPPLITAEVPDRSPEFTGQIYDWRVFPERSTTYHKPSYTLFRGVNPAWDNTARRKSNGTILYGSSNGTSFSAMASNASFSVANIAIASCVGISTPTELSMFL